MQCGLFDDCLIYFCLSWLNVYTQSTEIITFIVFIIVQQMHIAIAKYVLKLSMWGVSATEV